MGLGSRWQAMLEKTGNLGSVVTDWVSLLQNPGYEQELSADFRRSIWQEAAVAADRNNYPGLFTAFVGLNLFQSAFTDWYPMMSFLRRLGVSG